MAASYHRVWIRFENAETKRRLEKLRQEMSEQSGRKISRSKLVESVVEQFLDRHSPASGSTQNEDS